MFSSTCKSKPRFSEPLVNERGLALNTAAEFLIKGERFKMYVIKKIPAFQIYMFT
jgi:hypothetical protein